jgi:type VI protein secretion system component VasK
MSTVTHAWQALQTQADTLWQALQQRLQPLVIQLEPIWSDPLWQFIGLLIAALLMLWLLYKLGQWSWDVLVSLASAISQAIGKPIKWLEKANAQRRQRQQQQAQQAQSRWRWLTQVHVRQGIDVVRYLTTRRDWRYRSQWFLLSGLDDSGKSHWIDSVAHTTRTQLLAREKQLISEGSQWRFFDHGAVIEVEQESKFDAIVDLLNFYRPERPIDGLILTISAPQLLAAQDPLQQRELGERLYQQLWQAQRKTGFVMPVYVQITQCDHIPGFQSFWQARESASQGEMFGWSNPYRIDQAFSDQWINEGFDDIIDGVRNAQLVVAAAGQDIADIDAFMLFDRELTALQAPLAAVLSHAFARSSFQDALPLRGFWLSGRVDDQIVASEEFFSHKLWPEKHLAYPQEQRLFSLNRILRRVQYASLAVATLLCMALAIDSYQLYRYTQASKTLWAQITLTPQDSSPDAPPNAFKQNYCERTGASVWWLLSKLSQIGQQPNTLAIPASWGGGQSDLLQETVAREILPARLFAGMDCRLEAKADEVRQLFSKPLPQQGDLAPRLERLLQLSDTLSRYQQARMAFIKLAEPTHNRREVAPELKRLLDYLYDSPMPASIDFDGPLIAGAVEAGTYDHDFNELDKLKTYRQLTQLDQLAATVQDGLIEQVTKPPVAELRRAFMQLSDGHSGQQARDDMNNALQAFQSWLAEVRRHWLLSNADSSPCGQTLQHLQQAFTPLEAAGYSPTQLQALLKRFQPDDCDGYIRAQLESLNIPPIGPFFQPSTLAMTPELTHWSDEFAALRSLPFLSASTVAPAASDSASHGNAVVVGWRRTTLVEALDAMLAYQSFTRQWYQTDDPKPFYSNALQHQLQRRVQSLIRGAQVYESVPSSEAVFAEQDSESSLAASVASFETVQTVIQQLLAVLKQEGDEASLALLQNLSQRFAQQQLKQLDQLVETDRLYLPLRSPQWASANFAGALFSYPTEAEINSYLQNQRQRTSYMANLYAKPLVGFLIDTQGVSATDTVTQRWLDTLRDLKRYQRQQPGNPVNELETFVGTELQQLTAAQCNTWLQQPISTHTGGGLFAKRHYSIEQQVRQYCQQYGKNTVIKRYLALAERFNQELAGHFPFASLEQAGKTDISASALASFLNDYRQQWAQPLQGQTLLQGLEALVKAQPQLALDSWLVFVRQIDQLATLWQHASDDNGALAVNLNVEFAALPDQSLGMRQIVQWDFSSGNTLLRFPNGEDQAQWGAGDALQLTLRWASGSDFRPARNSQHPVQIDDQQRSAVFTSAGAWSLFEWWQRFASPTTANKATRLTFEVPVVGKTTDKGKRAAYLSKINLLVTVTSRQNGQNTLVTVPAKLPTLAPGIPGDQHLPGGHDLALTQQP